MSEPTSYAYQWNRGGVPIPGATAQQYTVQTADANIVLTCTVYGINSATPSGVAVLSGPTAPVTVPTPVVAAAPPTLANGGFGFFNPNGSANLASDLTHVESVTGRHMDLVMEYANWDNGTSAVPTPTTSLLTACNGRPLMWTVQPSSGPYGATTANCVQWQSLIAGTYDSELTAFGTWVNANITGTIFVRFAHEANGTGYYDWQVGGTCGVTSAANYAAGFNHVAAVLKAASSKIVMVWAANNGPTANIGSFYPSGCDIMGFDSYNFGPNTSSTGVSAGGPSSTWQAAATLNAAVYAAVAACDPQKPIWVCETSCEEPSAPWTEPTSGVVIAAQTGVDKGQWVSAFLAETDMPRVAMVVWFDFQKERNWLVDSSTSSANAFYAGFSQSRSGAVYWNATNGGLPGYTPAGMAIGVAMGSDQTLFTASDKGLSQYQAMTAAGFAGVRIDLGVVNATPTTLNSSIDATIRAAVTAGLASRTVLILDGYHPNLITQANFVAFCVEAADTYSALGIHNFEIINEVNGNGAQDTSTGYVNPAAYAALLAAVYPAIHAADPLANVMFSGMPVFYGSDGPSEGSGNYGTPSGASFASLTPGTFLTLAYTAMGGSSTAYFDSMGAHPYCFPAAPSATNNWGILMNPPGTSGPSGFGSSVRQIMAANGDTAKPMWVTEFGYETSGDGSSVSTANQAAYLSQALTLAKGYRYVAGFMIFNWADDTDGDFGLNTSTYTAKPALAAVESLIPTTSATGVAGVAGVAGFTIPGYADPSDYASGGSNYSTAITLPALNQSYGGNWIALQSQYCYPNWGSTTLASSGTSLNGSYTALSMTAITDMTAAAKACSPPMSVCLKPHNGVADSYVQSMWVPLGQFSISSWGSTTSTASYTTNSSTINCSGSVMALTSAMVGWRVVGIETTYYYGNAKPDIPNSCYTTSYATGPAPAYSTVGAVLNPTSFTLANASGAAINPGANSSSDVMIIVMPPDVVGGPAQTAFDAWQIIILNSIAAAISGGGCDAVNLATEHELWTRYFPTMWRNLVANVRAQYPNVLLYTQSSEGLDYGADTPFVDVLDAIGVSAYPTVGSSSGGDNASSVNSAWVTATHSICAGYYAAWGKPVIFGEIGTTSSVAACYDPASYGGQAAQNPSTEQALFFTGMANACIGQPWFGGFFWWTGFAASSWRSYLNNGTYSDSTSYEPKAATVTAMQAALG